MKVFNEKETAEILKRAAVKSHHTTAEDSLGLTLQELEEIASESGINPKQISRAIQDIELQRLRPEQTFWGGPFSFYDQVQVDHEITAAEWEVLLASFREFFQSKGEISVRDSVYEWSSPWGTTNAAHVTALKDQAKTKISVSWNGPLTALPFYLPIPLVGIGALFFASEFMGLGAVPGLSFVALSMGVTFAAGRWALRRHMKNGVSKLRALTAKLQGSSQSSLVQDQQADAEPLLDLESGHIDSGILDSKMPRRSRE